MRTLEFRGRTDARPASPGREASHIKALHLGRAENAVTLGASNRGESTENRGKRSGTVMELGFAEIGV